MSSTEVYSAPSSKHTHCEYTVMPASKVDRLNIRIDERLKKRMKRQAKKEQRSVSNMILKVMRDYLDDKEKK